MFYIITNDKKHESFVTSSSISRFSFTNYELILKENSFLKIGNKDKICFFVFNQDMKYIFKILDFNSESNIDYLKKDKIFEILNKNKVFFITIEVYDSTLILEQDTEKISNVYYSNENNKFTVTSSLDNFFDDTIYKKLDNFSVAFSIFMGGRPPKSHTLYQNIKRLNFNEYLKICKNNLEVMKIKLNLINQIDFNEKDYFENYSDLFISSVEKRSSKQMNAVLLSSGWDSTSILGTLNHLWGNKKVTAFIGALKCNKNGNVFNSIEIEKAKKFAEFYKIELHIVDLCYDTEKFFEFFENSTTHLKKDMLYCFAALHYWEIARKIKALGYEDISVFSGEFSDGAHNLGFSQFVSLFHPNSFDFREYSDKFMSYLFGPTFFNKILNDSYKDDPVWKILNLFFKDLNFFDKGKNNFEIKQNLLLSFFGRSFRFPFVREKGENILKKDALEYFDEQLKTIYFDQFVNEINDKNIYSAYLSLYESFHWQSADVSSQAFGMFDHQLRIVHPFKDDKIIKLLMQTPERFGRGLDLNRTKFGLKKFLKNKIEYPIDLQSGPHSYMYDIDENADGFKDILYKSYYNDLLKKQLNEDKMISRLSDTFFNNDKLYKMFKDVKNGVALSDLSNRQFSYLSLISTIKLYD